MVVKRGMMDRTVEHAVENIGVVNLQARDRFQGHCFCNGGFIPGYWKLAGRHIDQHGAVPNYLGVEGEFAEGTAFHDKSGNVLNIFVIIRKATEIVGPQDVGLITNDGGNDEVRFEIKGPIEAIDLLDRNPVVIP